MNSLPQSSGIDARNDAPQTIGAAERTVQPALPELCGPRHPHRVQAPQSGPVDGQNGFYHQGSGDPWKRALIGHPIEDSGGELKDLFRIADQASENGLLLSLLQTLPFQIRKFFDQPLHLLLVAHCFPNTSFPLPGHKQLVQFSAFTANQVQTSMGLSVSTATVGLSTAHGAHREGAAEETSLVHNLRQTRAATTLAIRELCTLQGSLLLLYTIVYKKLFLVNGQTPMRICCQGSGKK
jgi:hypothetical protein